MKSCATSSTGSSGDSDMPQSRSTATSCSKSVEVMAEAHACHVGKAEVYCHACATACPLLSRVCPTCKCAPSFSVRGSFNLRSRIQVLHDGRGGGASNLVLLGSDRDLKQQVVVKTASLEDDAENLASLREEIRIQSRLAHANLVPFLHAVETPWELMVVTPFCSGGDLHEAVGMSGVLPEVEARNLCAQVLEGLGYLHGLCSVLHGDVKPRNIFLLPWKNGAFVAQLGDFGLSREVPSTGSRRCTFQGVQGTHGYMAPEIIAHEDYGFEVDLFALGVIMFTLIASYEPFYPASNVRAPLEFDESCWGHISEACQAVVTSLLRVEPEARLSANQARQAEWFRSSTPPRPLPPGAPKPSDLCFHPAAAVLEAWQGFGEGGHDHPQHGG
mmetsp:Transcript_108811/g.232511  ORF Transcript_108811/g.232511 Transcript_108811/m.232511 type:complete len:387 (+) Transcript_108811:56-1216(+)